MSKQTIPTLHCSNTIYMTFKEKSLYLSLFTVSISSSTKRINHLYLTLTQSCSDVLSNDITPK